MRSTHSPSQKGQIPRVSSCFMRASMRANAGAVGQRAAGAVERPGVRLRDRRARAGRAHARAGRRADAADGRAQGGGHARRQARAGGRQERQHGAAAAAQEMKCMLGMCARTD